ncbi:carbamoyltransferase HypF [Rhodococcus sp. SGAir0479]|uniref:carbamoyltransferase HypF n=1 Tax=Rhodococcus sp. SGAir0479 TaxID=2567884 RepID=UPI0010CD4081|nr:carbamoyltransferase HypF [Rhodococcus sp. SGAir0479]QCQ92653.1 carbamoyltransferase HypF [Rhodococcus sp. SGAir0479]
MTAETVVGRVAAARHRITVRGVVQGVGFRPFVARLAHELGLVGFCGNDEVSVFVEVEGAPAALAEFARRLRADAPPLAVVVDVTVAPAAPRGDDEFRIVDSLHRPGARTLVPPDVGICTDCARELADPADRRYRHPFVNCTNCGPRYTVITDLPYDRPSTTMARFPMCARCAREYADPGNRRYHAQPICCPDCGPRIFAEADGRRIGGDDAVLERVQREITDGGIVAVKGIGGFHLVCDATDPGAVSRLRARKQRPAKPFAVMAADLGAARTICEIDAAETDALTSPARPIVLLRSRSGSGVATGIAPGLDELGVLLPYAPLHHLLFAPVPGSAVRPPRLLVMTSGNLGGEPLCFDNDEARERLAGIADVFLLHDRDIAVPCEDSVLTVVDGTAAPIRRSRGYAPLPVLLDRPGPTVLAVGAEVKNTFCLTRQDFAFCSAHLGDMGSLESRLAFDRSVSRLSALQDVRPDLVVADDHPGYSTRSWAEDFGERTDTELITVQHHHAHVAALAAEHRLVGTPLLGIAFDGTGYGCDRTVWGGEFLTIGEELLDARRAGHLQPFALPGGDVAVRNPARVALALLRAAGIDTATDLPCVRALPANERGLVTAQLDTGLGCVRTTSVGRLFDGVASILGVRHRVSYEAQAAVELEALARTAAAPAELPMPVADGEIRLAELMGGLVDGVRAGTAPAELAFGFHCALAAATAALATDIADRAGVGVVGLTGGVFQNRLLTALVRVRLEDAGLRVLTHHVVPPNDGGLSLGQAALGLATLARRARTDPISEVPR